MGNNRNKAWRQAKKKCKDDKRTEDVVKKFIPEKNWKLMCLRSEKLRRAKQLRIDYPPETIRQKLDVEIPLKELELRNILFICSRNQWRSPTAEQVWKKHPELNVRSAGTSPRAKRTVNAKDIQWADIIFVMEEKHKNRLKAEFTRLLGHKDIAVLDIPDDYQFMDAELVEILQESVGSYLNVD